MQNRMFLKIILTLALVALVIPTAQAQCVSNVPDEIIIGQSACIQICANDFFYDPIQLVGRIEGPNGVPVLVLLPGCSAENTGCNVQCTPVTPPIEFILGGDPFFPNNYYAHNDCFDFYLYWNHDGTWALEIWNLGGCEGCFCLEFDDQWPVELLSPMTAVAGNSMVTLNWATASETNNDRFEIRRDGASVAELDGLGNSASGQTYTWTDRQVTNGTTYVYELISVDMNGTRHSLGTASASPGGEVVGVITNYALYQNYPNPFNPSTRISFDVVEPGFVTLKVYNPMGEEVATLLRNEIGAGRHSVDFNASSLPSGLYFYAITIGDHFSATRKMLLVK